MKNNINKNACVAYLHIVMQHSDCALTKNALCNFLTGSGGKVTSDQFTHRYMEEIMIGLKNFIKTSDLVSLLSTGYAWKFIYAVLFLI